MDSTLLRTGPANVYLYEGSPTPAPVNLGYLDEGLTLHVSPSSMNMTGAQNGTGALDVVITGRDFTVDIGLKEFSLENIQRAIPGAALLPSVTPTRVEISSNAGLSLRSIAKKMEVRPIFGGVEVPNTEWITIPLAAPTGDISLAFNNSDQRVLNVTFHCFPDDDNGGVALIYGTPPA